METRMDAKRMATTEAAPEETTVCPACHAEQSWSDECRRCKCDLSDLRAMWHTIRQAHAACLHHLRQGQLDQAVRAARLHATLNPGAKAPRLLAACHMINGNWPAAFRVARPRTDD